MAVLNEGKHAGEFIVSEVDIDMSRKLVTVVTGAGILTAGTVVGIITATGEYKIYDDAAIDGSEVAAGILFDEVDATAAAAEGIMLNNLCVVNNAELNWGASAAAAQTAAVADLKALNVFVKGA